MRSEAQRLFEKWAEVSLKTSGLVPRTRYLEALEENEGLRRRIRELEAELGIESSDRPPPSIDSVFDEMLSAQKRWLDTWMPTAPKDEDK